MMSKNKNMGKLLQKLKQNRPIQICTIVLRYLLGASFVHASIFKINNIRFMPEPSANAPINTLAHFFEAMYQLGFYWQFIGCGQLIIGFLLMSQMANALGAVAFFPMMLNIFIITFSFGSPNILLITFLMVLANLYLLIWDWNRLKFIVLPQPKAYCDDNDAFSKHSIWRYIGVVLFFIIVIMRILTTNVEKHE